ncbi:MAG: hypothetical protein O2973_11435 [Gemmatimonadetes bacterium]|nr:hypothetical protein [Gemmatimonadota bacterium]
MTPRSARSRSGNRAAEELGDKFRACAGRVLDAERTEAAVVMLQALDQLAETRTLTDCLSGRHLSALDQGTMA